MNAYMPQSNTIEWATPQTLFDELNLEFGFTLDAAASDINHKCDRYFTKKENSLEQNWDGVVWLNPPYGRDLKLWVRKAYEEFLRGSTVVCLVPSRTDTAWWHDYAMKGEVRFIRGRVKYVREDGFSDSAPFPSVLVIFR